MWLCFPAVLCSALLCFVFSLFLCFCFILFRMCFFLLLLFSCKVACYLVSPTPYFSVYVPLAWWAHTHTPSHHILLHHEFRNEHQMDSNTNVLPHPPNHVSSFSITVVKNEISAFFDQRAPKTYWESNIITAVYCET